MTFGCSFTKYHWPTWADIVLKQAELAGMEIDNQGMPGAGNLFIAIQIQNAIARGLLKPGDHVLIAWSTFFREDRLVDGRWLMPGNIFNQEIYPRFWTEKYADIEFYTLRDCALISATRAALAAHGITQTNFNMHWSEVHYNASVPGGSQVWDKVNKIIEMYKLKFDCKSIIEVLGHPPPITVKVNWSHTADPSKVQTDIHHLPGSMLTYVKQELCPIGIPWLTAVNPRVEAWALDWDNRVKTTPQPLMYADFPLVLSKNPQWGF
jgi:hypothetical protein